MDFFLLHYLYAHEAGLESVHTVLEVINQKHCLV